jgi:hypothetical protein
VGVTACQCGYVTESGPGVLDAARVDRGPRTIAICGAIGAGAGCLLAAVYIVHRAPCPPNYVRLIDLGVVALALLGLLLVAELAVVLATKTPGRHRIAGTFAVLLGVGVLALFLPALSLALSTFGSSRIDTGCWTF